MMGNVYYDKLCEDRGWYFTEYSPAFPGSRLASLALVVHDKTHDDLEEIAKTMEVEAEDWCNRYNIPLFTCAVDHKECNVAVSKVRQSNFLCSYREPGQEHIQHDWGIPSDDTIPDVALDEEYRRKVYAGLPCRSDDDISREQHKRVRKNKQAIAILFTWLVGIPTIIAILGWANPIVSIVALGYCLLKAIDKGMMLLGKKKPTEKELKKQRESRMKDHFYYHCTKNPSGFERLKLENFRKEAADQVKQDLRDIRGSTRE